MLAPPVGVGSMATTVGGPHLAARATSGTIVDTRGLMSTRLQVRSLHGALPDLRSNARFKAGVNIPQYKRFPILVGILLVTPGFGLVSARGRPGALAAIHASCPGRDSTTGSEGK